MAITPLYVGEIHKPLSLTWQDDTGTALDLTAATITVVFGTAAGSTRFVGTGTVNITNAAQGKFTYTFSTADVATAGSFSLQFKADYGASSFQFSDPVALQILPLL